VFLCKSIFFRFALYLDAVAQYCPSARIKRTEKWVVNQDLTKTM